jgi:hypothetical protein
MKTTPNMIKLFEHDQGSSREHLKLLNIHKMLEITGTLPPVSSSVSSPVGTLSPSPLAFASAPPSSSALFPPPSPCPGSHFLS